MSTRKERKDILGCDIGNGYGYVSVLQNPAADPIPMFPPKYKLTSTGMPTAAYVKPPDGSEIEVFSERPAVEKYRQRDPERLVHAIKTRLKTGMITVPGIAKPVSPDKLYAAAAEGLIRLANEQRKNKGEEPIYDVVFAFPVSIADDISLLNRMQSSIESVRFGDRRVRVAGRLPEPAAVAIDYLYYMQNIAPESVRLREEQFTVLVYDLGHGTFDAAVVTARSRGEPYQVHLKEGLPDVGGKNFDGILYDEICRILKTENDYEPENADEEQRIRSTAIEMKHELSEEKKSVQSIQMRSGDYVDVTITRERFEELSMPLLNQTFELVDQLMEQAESKKIKIDAVVLSGGASRMPMVLNRLEKRQIPVRRYRPSEAVSYGTSRYAYGLEALTSGKSEAGGGDKVLAGREDVKSNRILEQFAEYSYGILLPDGFSERVRIMVERGDKLPAVSGKLRCRAASSRISLRVYRCASGRWGDRKELCRQYKEVIRIPFNVPCGREFELVMIVQEDYNVRLICRTEDGRVMEKSTSDSVEKLLS